MSGKEPPKGPRALRTPAPYATGASYQAQNQNYYQPTTSTSRGGLGVAPPTGPRSLANVNGLAGGRHPPSALAAPKGHVNGFAGRAPPSGPKGKGLSSSVSPTNTSATWVHGRLPPSGPSALMSSQRTPNGTGVGMSTASRAPISFSFPPPPQPKQPPPPSPPHPPPERSSERPPSPSSLPPPPPPPRSPPPPPPPPAEVPHHRSPISIRLPSAHPQEPRLAPPPLPPSPLEPPGPVAPQPPSFAPPPLPPTDPRRPAAIPVRPPPSYRRSPSPPREASGSRPPPISRASSPERPPTPLPDGVTVTYKRVPGHQHPQKLYSLHTPPMPDRSTYRNSSDRDYRVLFDSGCDRDRTGEMKLLIDTVHSAGADDRIDKGKGKPILYRYEGETVKGEKEARARDPRKEAGFKAGKYRTELYTTSYEYDSNSIGPEPPTNILIFGFPELTQSAKIRQHFQKYGAIVSFERELDRATGGQMGVASITYSTHVEAKRAVEGEEGKNFTLAAIGGGPIVSFANSKGPGMEKDSVKVVFDGEGKLLKIVIGLYEERRRREKERERGRLAPQAGEGGLSGTPTLNGQVARPMSTQQNDMPRRPFAGPHPPDQHPHPNHRSLTHPPGPHLPHKPAIHVAPNAPPRVGPSNFARGPGFHYGDRFGMNQNARRHPPPSLVRARAMNTARSSVPQNMPPSVHNLQTPDTDSRSATPIHVLRGRGGVRGLVPGLAHQHSHSRTPTYTSTSTPRGSRSPSPALFTRRSDEKPSHEEKEAKHQAIVQALVGNGYDHARIDGKQLSGRAAREEDVREFFKGFPVDEVLHDHTGWYITFQKPDAASRAARVLAIGTHTLANRSVSISVHPAPLPEDVKNLSPTSLEKGVDAKREWKPDEMVEEASKTVKAELLALLEKDVMERIVGAHVRKMISETKGRKAKDNVVDKTEAQSEKADGERERRRLQGLSFKKRKQKTESVAQHVQEPDLDKEAVTTAEDADEVLLVVTRTDEEPLVAVTLTEDETDLVLPTDKEVEKEERPRKRRKAETRVVRDEDLESEDGVEVEESKDDDDRPVHVEGVPIPEPEPSVASPIQRKRSLSPTPVEEPPTKRTKISVVPTTTEEAEIPPPSSVVPPPVKSKKSSTKKAEKEKEKKTTKRPKKAKAERGVLEALVIPPQLEVEAPAVTEVHVSPSPTWASVPSPAPPPSAIAEKLPSPKRYSALPESVLHEIVEDDEDLFLTKLALSVDVDSGDFRLQEKTTPSSDPNAPPPFRKHVTGSARSEGYYKISHTEKSAYVAQYALRGSAPEGPTEKEVPAPKQPIVSSRSNRANARRRAQGLEEMNQLQLAVALSKGENAATEVMKFNQLQTRKKHLRFARSPIHDWGLYAMERISRGEMVIEYVGEIIRAAVADKREKAYERQGIGSSYLFRIDEDLVVDATKKGNLGRLINHSCDPNCTAKIITINGEKKIVIYAKQDIELGDEITYDYHFPIEQDKIPCLCGSAKCRGFLN